MDRWQSHAVQSWLIRILAVVIPVVAAVAAAVVVGNSLPEPDGLVAMLGWWAALIGASLVVLALARKLAGRFLPLAVLLQLSLTFPDRAPSRFKLAMRSWSTKRLARRVAEARERGFEDDATKAAESLLTLVAALGRHDSRTRGHAERTRAYTELLAEELGLDQDDRERLRWAALLHDIGKLAVPAEILGKQAPLGHDDWSDLVHHPERGFELIRSLHDFLGEWAQTVLHHHERFDGSGYPAGLSGEEICLGARIVAVADAFDAMTSTRSYQPPRPVAAARKELAYRAGSQFDPEVVRAFLNVSIGSLRWILGPISFMAALPFVGGLRRLGQTGGLVATAAAGVFALTMGGIIQGPMTADRAAVLGEAIGTPAILIDVAAEGDVDPASISIVTPPAAGIAVVNGDGTISYQAPSGFAGVVSLRYRACSDDGICFTEELTLQVDGLGKPRLAAAPEGAVTRAQKKAHLRPLRYLPPAIRPRHPPPHPPPHRRARRLPPCPRPPPLRPPPRSPSRRPRPPPSHRRRPRRPRPRQRCRPTSRPSWPTTRRQHSKTLRWLCPF